MTNTPCVCIMIPTYNQADYIIKAVESALAQDYPALEVLVADDHSDFDTAALLEEHIKSNKIKYYRNAINLGRVANYRKMLYENTAADWVINLDGDDYFTNSSFISQAMDAIQKAGEQNILFYQGVHVSRLGGKVQSLETRIREQELILTTTDYFFGYFTLMHFSHMSTLYNQALAIQSGFYEKDVLSADIFSFLQSCLTYKDKKVIVSKNISGVWLHHDSNSSKTVQVKQHWNNFYAFKNLYRQALEKGYGKIRCFKWLMKARYIYLRTFAGTIIRKLK